MAKITITIEEAITDVQAKILVQYIDITMMALDIVEYSITVNQKAYEESEARSERTHTTEA